jgi:hypothetical protein
MDISIRYPERLEALRVLLLEDAANAKGLSFDLAFWAAPSGPTEHSLPRKSWTGLELDAELIDRAMEFHRGERNILTQLPQDKLPPITCSTTACAMGLAMLSKKFEQFGLITEFYLFAGLDERKDPGIVMIPSCNGETGFDAAAELFGISSEIAQYLFDPDYYNKCPSGAEGELVVADRIEDFLNGIIADARNIWDDEVGED